VVFFNYRPPNPAYRALVRVSRERIAIFLAELIDYAERNNPETSTFFSSKLCEIAALTSLRNKWESKNEQ
jgi:hypothetical protein